MTIYRILEGHKSITTETWTPLMIWLINWRFWLSSWNWCAITSLRTSRPIWWILHRFLPSSNRIYLVITRHLHSRCILTEIKLTCLLVIFRCEINDIVLLERDTAFAIICLFKLTFSQFWYFGRFWGYPWSVYTRSHISKCKQYLWVLFSLFHCLLNSKMYFLTISP